MQLRTDWPTLRTHRSEASIISQPKLRRLIDASLFDLGDILASFHLRRLVAYARTLWLAQTQFNKAKPILAALEVLSPSQWRLEDAFQVGPAQENQVA